jgi:hypothetical protein
LRFCCSIGVAVRIPRIGGYETVGDGNAPAVSLQRLLELALRRQHIADHFVRSH